MNAVEIADAVSQLAEKPFDPLEFPFEFLAAFGNKETTLARLRKGDTNSSDVSGGVLQKNNIHLAVCEPGMVEGKLRDLRSSPKTDANKAKFILATDGITLGAEELRTGEVIASEYPRFADHFGFFLPLAGISTVKEIKENPIDVRATGRLNKLYVELLKTNEDWQTEARRVDLNHFFARLIFCFFAEDTHIFRGDGLFTQTIQQMTLPDGTDACYVLRKLFEAMNLSLEARKSAGLPAWADGFPYVNGGLFSDDLDVPSFSRTARSYLLRAGELNWREINPDIFGSMIQAVADDEERGALGMHYTSVPNILKVLNPLFLDDLRDQLDRAGEHKASLLKLRERMKRIRVFDPACGSGNFLVIAYKEMRKVEAEINRRRGEPHRSSDIPLTNFRGIEIRDFAAEIARLALIIAEYQADVLYRGERLALAEFLPLNRENWIWKGNALRLDWATVCPPMGTAVNVRADDLFGTQLEQTEMDFVNAGGETYLCGNPPYKGSRYQTTENKSDLQQLFKGRAKDYSALDYVAGWFIKAADFGKITTAESAFVATNSLCQGQQVAALWPLIFSSGHWISFCHTSFKWANLASYSAGVTVVIVGLSRTPSKTRKIYSQISSDESSVLEADFINGYLIAGQNVIVRQMQPPPDERAPMQFGNHFYYGAPLLLSWEEARRMEAGCSSVMEFVRPFYGSKEVINGLPRACLWIRDADAARAMQIPSVKAIALEVARRRLAARQDTAAVKLAETPYRFRDQSTAQTSAIVIPGVSSENRPYLPVDLVGCDAIVGHKCFALYDAPLWNLALIASRLHWVWIGTVCVRMRTDFSYSNTLGWNTFPVPPMTIGQKDELTKRAEEILLAREAHFPATIADLYAPDAMPEDLRRAHDRNDETLERIYIGRRFRNDTERLEKLFEMYTAMTAKEKDVHPKAGKTRGRS